MPTAHLENYLLGVGVNLDLLTLLSCKKIKLSKSTLTNTISHKKCLSLFRLFKHLDVSSPY